MLFLERSEYKLKTSGYLIEINIKVLNPINYTKINEYLLDSLEECLEVDDFCLNCYKLLSDYVQINNFIVYKEEQKKIDLIYQSNWHHSNGINYPLVINLITEKYANSGQRNFYLQDSFSCLKEDFYCNWLKKEKINYLSIFNLDFKKELLGKVFIEIK